MKYKDILKLKWPNKNPIQFIDDTYEGIVWNVFDQTPNPTKAELDAVHTAIDAEGTYITGEMLNDSSSLGIVQSTGLSLVNSGVLAGTYPKVTVDAKGRVTAGSVLSPSDLPNISWSQISGVPSILPNLSKAIAIAGISGTSTIPYDNTTPLVTEGTQIASATCTPSDPLSKLAMQGALVVDCASSNRNLIISAFRDSTCIGVTVLNFVSTGRPQMFPFLIIDDHAGPLLYGGSAVYSLRFGVNSSTTWYVNRTATATFNGLLTNNDVLIWEYL